MIDVNDRHVSKIPTQLSKNALLSSHKHFGCDSADDTEKGWNGGSTASASLTPQIIKESFTPWESVEEMAS